MALTYKEVQQQLRRAGIVISKRGAVHRINVFDGLENTAFYTESLEEALETGLRMARPRGNSSSMAARQWIKRGG
jgi:gentisate 1,2-dioxygenase